MNRFVKNFAVLALTAIFFSCVSNEKIIYMQKLAEEAPLVQSGQLIPYEWESYRLQNFDIVDINIKTTSEELNMLLDVIVGQAGGGGSAVVGGGGGQAGGDAFFMNGYTIDEEGKVELPLIGELAVLGLTTKETQTLIESKLINYINEDQFFVRVRLGGIRYSALGEFNSPGKRTILQNRVTIFEAIAAAQDLSILAKRDEVVLLRQYPEGSQIHRINLNDEKLIGSEFYFIKPNDVIYAEPLKVREIGNATNFIQTLTLLTTTVTAVALILNLVK
ncbi:polysaccharide biosynthesis/export family protein [Algoriphagus zhangzhouensis]|uniref:Polysaccharide export outer membrane protein n=1 Tax=Algoriphagus zhangzhouensis TaxID=1073327 RepID=A0A1M7ZHV2_9BACT|nr:polysaccharide biosynthesis/export family protein [Algoriphagus zhangzhouensis]TDY44253.1 polysaccharide export outer membrane protein [Algoriphagus zhangzhouensis]SHO64453.1 polysaccharide export outer membrane protein [Algoriphagus zhangzhouensis]